MPIFLLAAGAVFLGWWLQALGLTGMTTVTTDAAADAEASQFVAYQRAAAQSFMATDPVTGLATLPDSAMNLPPGYATAGRWHNATLQGELYLWPDSRYTVPPGFVDVLNSLGRHACIRRPDIDGVDCPDGLRHLPPALAAQIADGRPVSVGS